MVAPIFKDRTFSVKVWNPTPNMVSALNAAVEIELKKLGHCQIVTVKSLDEIDPTSCDLIVCLAHFIGDEEFPDWIRRVEQRIPMGETIKVPFLIIARLEPFTLRDILSEAVQSNWYFDVVDPDHLPSVSVRMANFIRLHDHLHEVFRMTTAVDVLSKQVRTLEGEIESIKKAIS
jgi:hypothetical protein